MQTAPFRLNSTHTSSIGRSASSGGGDFVFRAGGDVLLRVLDEEDDFLVLVFVSGIRSTP